MTKMHLYKIEEGLWFHLIPVLENNFDDWQALYESLSDKCVRNQDGYGIFGEVLAFAQGKKGVDTFVFLASEKQYNASDNLPELPVEMMMAVSIDTEGKVSQHLGIQRYKVAEPHSKISVKAHSFCASVTKREYSDTTYMLTHPLKKMREILSEAFEGKEGMKIVKRVDEDGVKFLASGLKVLEFSKPLPSIVKVTHPGNSPDVSSPMTITVLDDLAAINPLDMQEFHTEVLGDSG